MPKTGLTRQLSLAFGALMALTALIGGIAAWRMFVVNQEVRILATRELPGLHCATELERAVLATMFAMRGYENDGDEADLTEARVHLGEVDTALNAIGELVKKSPARVTQTEELKTARAAITRYRAAVDQTVAAHQAMTTARTAMKAATGKLTSACEDFDAAQDQQLAAELGAAGAAEQIAASTRKIQLAARIGQLAANIRIRTWQSQADNDPGGLLQLDQMFQQIATAKTELDGLTTVETNRQHLDRIMAAAASYQEALAALRTAMVARADLSDDRVGIAREVRDIARNTAAANIAAVGDTGERTRENMARTAWGVLAAVVVALLAAAGAAIVLTTRIARPLREGSNVLATATNELSATVSQIAAGASETAAAVQQTTITVDEVRQTARLASEKAAAVLSLAQAADASAQDGRVATEKAVQGMQQIDKQMRSIADGILRLSEQSQTIGDVTSTVGDLAEQSNLLAVNAAIEAAKAGEQGLGFAVVAQEIRSLAEQSKEATANIRTILGDIQKATTNAVLSTERGSKAVDEGLELTRQAGQTIESLAASVEEAASAATQISASSQQQLVGMEQVASAMSGIQEASVQNQESTRQLNVAIGNLGDLGVRLRAMIDGEA